MRKVLFNYRGTNLTTSESLFVEFLQNKGITVVTTSDSLLNNNLMSDYNLIIVGKLDSDNSTHPYASGILNKNCNILCLDGRLATGSFVMANSIGNVIATSVQIKNKSHPILSRLRNVDTVINICKPSGTRMLSSISNGGVIVCDTTVDANNILVSKPVGANYIVYWGMTEFSNYSRTGWYFIEDIIDYLVPHNHEFHRYFLHGSKELAIPMVAGNYIGAILRYDSVVPIGCSLTVEYRTSESEPWVVAQDGDIISDLSNGEYYDGNLLLRITMSTESEDTSPTVYGVYIECERDVVKSELDEYNFTI